MNIYVGISGWTYDGWRGTFYPPKLPHKKELFFASHALPTIEINGTFYALQRPASYHKWFEETPDDFVFSIKANRYITHINRLKDPKIPMANFLASGLFELRQKLGPILWQFPPSMSFDPDRWKNFLDLLPRTVFEARKLAHRSTLPRDRCSFQVEEDRPLFHAVEIRHPSFLNPWFIELLKEHQITLVFADTAGKWPYMEDITGNILYLRLHGDSELYVSGYDDATLDFWAARIQEWQDGQEPSDRLTLTEEVGSKKKKDVFVYFDNDAKVRAPADAKTLISKLHMAPKLLHKS